MKVTIQTINLNSPVYKTSKYTESDQVKKSNDRGMELPNFDTNGRSLVTFKGDIKTSADNHDLANKTIEQLEELKSSYTADIDEREEKRQKAQANLDKIKAWNYDAEYEKQAAKTDAEIRRRGLSRFWNPFQCSDIKSRNYNQFLREKSEIDELKARKEIDETIISYTPLSKKDVDKLVEQIDMAIAQKKQLEQQRIRLDGIDGVQRTLNSMENAQGGLKERIAGYETQKDELKRKFLNPLAESKRIPSTPVPACVMLHGATGTGKTAIINAIGHEGKEGVFADVVDLSVEVLGNGLEREIAKAFKEARTRYQQEGKRTIILINEAQRFLAITPEEAKKEYGDLIDEIDLEKLRQYGNCSKFIEEFKSLLDCCSEIPDEDEKSGRSAVSFFFTTNYPHLMNRDVLRKINYIAINPAKNDDLQAVVKHYAKICSDTLTQMQKLSELNDFQLSDIDSLSTELSVKARANVKKMIQEGTFNKLKIDYEKIPYENLPADFNPNRRQGAINNQQFRDSAINAFNKYLEEPESSYYSHLYETLYNLPREISPARYKKFVDIYNALAPLNQQEYDEEIDTKEKEQLLKMERAGALDGRFKVRLEQIRAKEASELAGLEEKEKNGTLSELDRQKLEEIRKSTEVEEDPTDDDEYWE